MKLARFFDPTGLNRSQDRTLTRFEADVAWLRSTTTNSKLMEPGEGGQPVANFTTFNDFYGLLTSKDEPLSSAVAMANRWGLNEESRLYIEVVLTCEDIPILPPAPVQHRRRELVTTPSDWLIDDERLALAIAEWQKPDEQRDWTITAPRLKTEERKFTIWRSDWLEAANTAALEAAVNAVSDGLEA